MQIELYRATELTHNQITALRTLSQAVYSPESNVNWPGRTIEWATAEWRIFCRDERPGQCALFAILYIPI